MRKLSNPKIVANSFVPNVSNGISVINEPIPPKAIP